MLGNDCNKLMNMLMNSQTCTQGSGLRQTTSSDPNNISQQFHRCAIKAEIPLLCQSESHRKSSLQQHGPPVPEGGHIHFPPSLLLPQGRRDSHGISHPVKQELCHTQSLLQELSNQEQFQFKSWGHSQQQSKHFGTSHTHSRTCFPDPDHPAILTYLGGNRIQLNLPSPAAALYPSAPGGFQFLNGLIPPPSQNQPTPVISIMKTWRCNHWAQAEGFTWGDRVTQGDTFSQEQCEDCPAELCSPNIRATRAFNDPQTQKILAEDHNQITKLHLRFAIPSAGPWHVPLSHNYSLPPRFLGSAQREMLPGSVTFLLALVVVNWMTIQRLIPTATAE